MRVGNSGGSGAVSVEKGWTEWVIDVRPDCAVLQSLTFQGVEDGSRVGIDPKLISLGKSFRLMLRAYEVDQ